MSGISTAPGRYCELHAHSYYSLLDGVPSPEELTARAAELGLPAIALTDHDALYGIAPFWATAQAAGVKPVIGAEITLDDDGHLTLLAETQAGYRNLCRLITLGRANAPKGEARLPRDALPPHAEGLICLTGCRRGPVARRVAARDWDGARAALEHLLSIFGQGNLYIELQRNLRRDDYRISRGLAALASERGLKYVATGNVHYLTRADADLQSALVSIRERIPLPHANDHLRPNHEYFLRPAAAMRELYPDLPEAVANTLEVAERCHAVPPAGLQTLPQFESADFPPAAAGPKGDYPDTRNPIRSFRKINGHMAYLRGLCLEQLPLHYPRNLSAAAELLEKELDIIERLGLANYFLVVWDIVAFCRRRGILCHGRGSAANSLVAKLLGISAVDPIEQGLVVERFIPPLPPNRGERGGTAARRILTWTLTPRAASR